MKMHTLLHRSKSSSHLLALAVMTLALLSVGCVSLTSADGDGELGMAEENQNHSFTVGANPTIEVTNFNGPIEVVTGPVGEVTVETKLRKPSVISYTAQLDGNTVIVQATKVRKVFSIGQSPRAEIRVVIPQSADLDIQTSNGPINVDGVSGDGELDSSNGPIILTNSNGAFEISTVNGGIVLTDVSGEFEAETTNGRVEFNGTMVEGSENSLSTSNGSIVIAFTTEPDLQLDARTSNGSVDNDIPILTTSSERTRLVGKYGDGSGSLQLRTSNGSIEIR